jgi:hypothetical protein
MRKLKFFWILLMFLCLFVTGCGSDGTNGSISLTATTISRSGGVYSVAAVAVLSPVGNNADVTITYDFTTLSGSVNQSFTDQNLKTDANGTVSSSRDITQTTEPIYVTVTAHSDNLTSIQKVTIPALAVP